MSLAVFCLTSRNDQKSNTGNVYEVVKLPARPPAALTFQKNLDAPVFRVELEGSGSLLAGCHAKKVAAEKQSRALSRNTKPGKLGKSTRLPPA